MERSKADIPFRTRDKNHTRYLGCRSWDRPDLVVGQRTPDLKTSLRESSPFWRWFLNITLEQKQLQLENGSVAKVFAIRDQ